MANEIQTKVSAKAAFTITLASLATAASRQSTMINNSGNKPAAIIFFRIESNGSAPTAGTAYEIYLLRGDDASSSTFRTDNAGASDAAITIENAKLIGTIVVTATTNKNFYGEFDTNQPGIGPLGVEWGIAVRNITGQSLNATEGNHLYEYSYYIPEVQ